MLSLDRLIQRLRRRLFLHTFLRYLLPWLAAGLGAMALWFVIQPLFRSDFPVSWKWLVPAAAIAVGALGALFQAYRRTPGRLAAALMLDEKFSLNERVTTLLTLSAEQLASPAGQALQADVLQHVAALELPSGFPLRLPGRSVVMPVGAGVLAVIAYFFPPLWPGHGGTASSLPAATARELENRLDNLKKVAVRKLEDPLNKEDLRELENAWDKLVKQPPPKTEEQIRERAKQMRDLQDKLSDRIKQLKELSARSKDLKNQLQKIHPDPKSTKEMRDLEDALAKGKLDKAADALERLAKKLEDKKLSKEEQQKLAEELRDLKQQLERLAEQREQKDQLQRDFDDGKISKEELEREMDRLAEEAENLKDLQELADLLGQCRDCLGKSGAAGKLRQLRGKLKAIELTEDELRALLEDQGNLDDAQDALLLALNECHGAGNMLLDGNLRGNGLGQSRLPGGRRPEGDEPKNSKAVNVRQHAETDPRGKHYIAGFTKGGIFSRIPAKEISGAFKQAVQDAPDAIDRQRIPPDASDMAKGYFKNLGGQK